MPHFANFACRGCCGIHINFTMKKTTENKPNIRLLPEETIELLKATLEEPPVSAESDTGRAAREPHRRTIVLRLH